MKLSGKVMCTKCSRSRVKFTMKKWRVSNGNEKWCGVAPVVLVVPLVC